MAVIRSIRETRPEPAFPHESAIDHLSFIRHTMESATAFTAVSGVGGMLMGATALLAAFSAHFSRSPLAWLAIWSGEALLAFAIALAFSYRKAMRMEQGCFRNRFADSRWPWHLQCWLALC